MTNKREIISQIEDFICSDGMIDDNARIIGFAFFVLFGIPFLVWLFS